MHDQPKLKSQGKSQFFADHRANRPLVKGTVANSDARTFAMRTSGTPMATDDEFLSEDDHYYRGRVDGKPATTFPPQVVIDERLLERGRERFGISCQPCHGGVGEGNGMAVRRGMKQPPSFHIDRLQKSPPGYFFDVITNGFGEMYDYADRIAVADRWAIVAYLQVLQLSQNMAYADLSAADKTALDMAGKPAAPADHTKH
jgi:mono/diheme cytochrome c family protein